MVQAASRLLHRVAQCYTVFPASMHDFTWLTSFKILLRTDLLIRTIGLRQTKQSVSI